MISDKGNRVSRQQDFGIRCWRLRGGTGLHTIQYVYMDHPFVRRLELGGPVLCDGAMGTILLARGAPSTHAFDELNLTDPRLVGGIHREYIAAGAEVIETNTFGANRVRLAPHGLEARVREINLHGVKIARDARE